MKNVKVVAAVILNENKVLATQRGYGDYKGWWEFPGGKVEEGETPQQALTREISEELDMTVSVGSFIQSVEYTYPTFHLSMDLFWCTISEGRAVLKEHEAALWLDRSTLYSVKWLPADALVLPEIEKGLA